MTTVRTRGNLKFSYAKVELFATGMIFSRGELDDDDVPTTSRHLINLLNYETGGRINDKCLVSHQCSGH